MYVNARCDIRTLCPLCTLYRLRVMGATKAHLIGALRRGAGSGPAALQGVVFAGPPSLDARAKTIHVTQHPTNRHCTPPINVWGQVGAATPAQSFGVVVCCGGWRAEETELNKTNTCVGDTSTCARTHTHTQCVRLCVCVFVCLCVFVRVCVFVCICVTSDFSSHY